MAERFNALLSAEALAEKMPDLSFAHRLEWDVDGTLSLRGEFGWREPICPVCQEPIKWVLDMMSFTSTPHKIAHARCVWTEGAFDNPSHRKARQGV